MSETLASRYRPTTFAQLVGQQITAIVLQRMVDTGDIPTGLLFKGVRGSGKTSAARIIASSMEDGLPIEVDAASHGTVQDVREMIDSLRYSSGGSRRVVIYDEAHSMSREAFNALLKTLEEPPAGVTFILVTTEPDKIPATVKSRLMEFSFHRISAADITARVAEVAGKESIPLTRDLAILIGERANGDLRDGLTLLEQCQRAGITTREDFLALAGEADVIAQLVQALTTGDHAHIFETADMLAGVVPDPSKLSNDLVSVLKDILILRSGGTIVGTEEAVNARKELAHTLETDRVIAGIKILWDLRTKARQSSDPRGNLDLALVLLSGVFTLGKQMPVRHTPVSPPEPARKLTLDEL